MKWKQYVWKRAAEIDFKDDSSEGLTVFRDKVEPSDIQQGALGDCYFLSSLSVLAEKSERIIRLFETTEVNEYGLYSIKICKNGEWQNILIDDFFPCNPDGTLAFS